MGRKPTSNPRAYGQKRSIRPAWWVSWRQHSETHDSATQVKGEVAGSKSIHLPGEASVSCALGCNMPIKGSGSVSNASVVHRGVSRDHSNLESVSGELKRLTKTENPRGLQMKGRTEEVEITGGVYERSCDCLSGKSSSTNTPYLKCLYISKIS